MKINEWAKEIHENAVEHGWWEEDRSFAEIIALCHSELSEALEEYRNQRGTNKIYFNCKKPDYAQKCNLAWANCKQCIYSKPEGIPVELADCIIRILDYCGKEGIDIEEAIKIKHEYNKTRPYKHGGKKI